MLRWNWKHSICLLVGCWGGFVLHEIWTQAVGWQTGSITTWLLWSHYIDVSMTLLYLTYWYLFFTTCINDLFNKIIVICDRFKLFYKFEYALGISSSSSFLQFQKIPCKQVTRHHIEHPLWFFDTLLLIHPLINCSMFDSFLDLEGSSPRFHNFSKLLTNLTCSFHSTSLLSWHEKGLRK